MILLSVTLSVIWLYTTTIQADNFGDWYSVNAANLKSSEYYINGVPNSYCNSVLEATSTGCHSGANQAGHLIKWYTAHSCMLKCNNDQCLTSSQVTSMSFECRYQNNTNQPSDDVQDLEWKGTCYCPAGSANYGSTKYIGIATVLQMKQVYDRYDCGVASAAETTQASLCSDNGFTLSNWLKDNTGTDFGASGFNISIPNLLCNLMAGTKGTGCEFHISKLPKWYFSQKCMEMCYQSQCGGYADLEVNCFSMPSNNAEQDLAQFSYGAHCICPADSSFDGQTKLIYATSFDEMKQEFRRFKCHDGTGVIQTASLACTNPAANDLINEHACGNDPTPYCDKHADCVSNTCQCKEGYTGNGHHCVEMCKVPIVDNALTLKNSANQQVTVGDWMEMDDLLEIECDSSSALIGTSRIACSCEGFIDMPACRQVCSAPPPDVSNGEITPLSNYTLHVFIGMQFFHTCNDRYILDGEVETICMPGGSYSTSGQRCLELCTIIPAISMGHLVMNEDNSIDAETVDVVVGDLFDLVCDAGYLKFQQSDDIVCQTGNTISIDTTAINCKKTCPDPTVTNGNPTFSPSNGAMFEGMSFSYTCNSGYGFEQGSTRVFSGSAVCQASGSYYPDVQECVEEKCKTFPTISNGKLVLKSTGNAVTDANTIVFVNAELEVECNNNYKLAKQSSSIVCQAGDTNTFDNTQTTCREGCTVSAPTNGATSGVPADDVLLVGGSYTWSCNSGYEYTVAGTSTTTGTSQCTALGTLSWTGTCDDIDECEPTNPCSAGEDCENDEGTYTCTPECDKASGRPSACSCTDNEECSGSCIGACA